MGNIGEIGKKDLNRRLWLAFGSLVILTGIIVSIFTWNVGGQKASAAVSGDFVYDEIIFDGREAARITGYTGPGGHIVIPNRLDGRFISEIKENAFIGLHITEITFPPNYIQIGRGAFSNTSGTIDHLYLHDSLFVGENAFRASGITSLTLSPNTTLRDGAFHSNQLTSLIIPEGTYDVPAEAFRNNSLTSLSLPNSLLRIRNRAFNDNQLTSVQLPAGLILLENYIFENNLLESIDIPSNLTTIPTGTFNNNKLKQVTLPDNLTTIGAHAFSNNALTEVTIPRNVTLLGENAFQNNNLSTVTFLNKQTTGLQNAFAGNSINQIYGWPSSTAQNWANETGIPFTSIIEFTPDEHVNEGQDLDSVTVKINLPRLAGQKYMWSTAASTPDSGSPEWAGFQSGDLLPMPASNGNWYLHVRAGEASGHEYFVHSGPYEVTALPGDFEYEIRGDGLSIVITGYDGPGGDIDIPETIEGLPVTHIGRNAFREKTITSIHFPETLTTIEEYAFSYNYGDIQNLVIPDTIQHIGEGAFFAARIVNLILNDSTELANGSFDSNLLTHLTIPDGVTTVPARAFTSNCIQTISLPESLTTIEDSAFRDNCLTSVTLPSQLIHLGDHSFADNLLTSIILPDSLTYFGKRAFFINQITQITFPSKIEEIPEGAFEVNQLAQLTLPETVRTIGHSAFSNNKFTELVVPRHVTSIGAYTFSGNLINKVTVLNANTQIHNLAFETNSSLTVYGWKLSPAHNYAKQKTIPFVSLVEFTPDGDAGEEQVLDGVTVQIHLPEPLDQHYSWTHTTTIPESDEPVWTLFQSGEKIDLPNTNGNWYLHVKARETSGFEYNTVSEVFVINSYDEEPPEITLTASPQTPTNGDVTVKAIITDNHSGVEEMKWAHGQHDAAYFTGAGGAGTPEGEVIPGSPASITVTENGWISVYARDVAGNTTVEQLQISNIDRKAPVITLQGEAVVKLTIGEAYTEPGYSAQDNVDGDVTGNVVVTGTVDTSQLGDYMLTYDVTDSVGNAAVQVTRTVSVVDEVPPTITLSASPTVPTNGNVIVEAVFTDNESGVVEMKWAHGQRDAAYFTGAGGAGTPEGEVIPGSPATWDVTENGWISVYARDLAGNTTVEQLQISNIDRKAPVITLQGEAVVKLTIGEAYTEPGFMAQDNVEGDVTDNVVVTGTVDTSQLGDYMLTYDVTDSVGNAAVQVTRTVRVVDEVPPTITLSASPTVPTNGNVIVEAVFTDNESGVVEMKWAYGQRDAAYFTGSGGSGIPAGEVIPGSPATWDVTENGWISVYARDLAGNTTVEQLQISNIDRVAPVITLQGDSVIRLTVRRAYTEPGYTAWDDRDGDISANVVITGTVDTNRTGEYTLYYNVTDRAGNAAMQVTRTVRVVAAPSGPPVIIGDGGSTGSPGSEEPGASEPPSSEPGTPEQPGTDENEGQGRPGDDGNHPMVEFNDTQSHWAQASIEQAVQAGIVSGYPDGSFKPNAPVTRAEFTIMLIRALKLEGEGSAVRFTDESSIGQWAQSAIAIAVQRGIISGFPDGSFRPNEPISRVQMAVMLAKVLGALEAGPAKSVEFADREAIPAWAADAVRTVADHEVMNGRSDNEFAPNEQATRAEAITVILRMLQAL
ncbi:leucine-rich repeat protein [Paenibacillus senegalensis]|uniref:leucine-rich repeat protein n=1 Tax=Paenibacillus senegalensis TaxID=1465766 RepID=UPI000288A593|nr:leucine-rich repeat protein [Paenibacillus senegalensis]